VHKLYIIIVRFVSNLTTQSSCGRFDLPLFCPVAVLDCRRFDSDETVIFFVVSDVQLHRL